MSGKVIGKLLGLGLLLLSLTGCPERHLRPDNFSEDPAPLLAAISQRSQSVRSLTGKLNVEIWRKDERVRLRQLVAAQQPDRLRIDSLSPFDQPISTLVSDGQTLSIYALDERRFYRGAASSKNLARLLPIRLSPRELSSLLRGEVPLIGRGTPLVTWNETLGAYRLEVKSGADRQVIDFEPKGLRVVGTTVWHGSSVAYRARLGDYDGATAEAIPQRMRFEVPVDELRIDIIVDDHRINPDLPDVAFKLEPPRGIPVESLD